MKQPEFDNLACDYEGSISPWMKLTGEPIDYYAGSRIEKVAAALKKHASWPRRILDFGCGVGLATPHFLAQFGSDCRVTGVDVSPRSLEVARATYPLPNVSFCAIDQTPHDESQDLVFCNGVFHHILPEERGQAVRSVYESLRPGGLFALWENNPWHPIVKYNMSHAAIDQNAVPLTSRMARQLVQTHAFGILETQYWFVFPHFLGFLRPLEAPMSRLPVGAQYLVLSRKPER